jgi:hypothetical protein
MLLWISQFNGNTIKQWYSHTSLKALNGKYLIKHVIIGVDIVMYIILLLWISHFNGNSIKQWYSHTSIKILNGKNYFGTLPNSQFNETVLLVMWTPQSYGSKVTMNFLEGSFMLLLFFSALLLISELIGWVVSLVGMQLHGLQLPVVSVWRKSWKSQTISARTVTDEMNVLQGLILQVGCVVSNVTK